MKRIPPNVNQLSKYDVNRRGQPEAIYQPLYDFQTYAAAGTTQLTFFAIPQGQSSKTLDDTNMEVAAALPAPKEFMVQSIEVAVFPGPFPSVIGAPAINDHVNDMYEIFKSGHLDLFIGSKSYLQDGPVGKFSNSFRLGGMAALSDSSTAGASQNVQIGYASFVGPRYDITPVRIPSNQNFKVTLNWNSAVAISADARIGVILNGFMYRLSQ